MNSLFERLNRLGYVFIVSFLMLFSFVVLFLIRALDDNRLTSWLVSFLYVNPSNVFLMLILSIIAAYFVSRLSFIERYPAAFLFIFSFLVLSLFWREPEIILDSSRYFTQAKYLEVYGAGYFIREWGQAIPAWTDMPAIPFIYGLIFKFFGEARIYIQIFTSILFSLTIVLTYYIGNTLWNRYIGLIAGILFLGVPYILANAPLTMVDVPVIFFVTLSVLLFIKALEQGGLFAVISAFSIAFTLFTKYSTWLMLTVLVMVFAVYLINESEGRGKIIKRALLVLAISALLTSALIIYKFDIFSEQLRLLLSFQRPGLKKWGESFLSTFFFQTHPFITIAAACSVYIAIKKRDLKYAIILWMVLLVFLFQIKRSRYIMMIFPMLSLMAAYSLAHIKNKEATKFLALSIAGFSIVLAFFAYIPMTEKISLVNLKDAAGYIDSLKGNSIGVFTVQKTGKSEANIAVTVPILDIYTLKNIRYEYVGTALLDKQEAEVSALRFTWEYTNPDYYSGINMEKPDVIALISDDRTLKLPANMEEKIKDYRVVRQFATSDEVFRFQSFVSVYSMQ